ncbi:MAG: hypothetical protein M3463_04620 [Verrucomicrobiota bacterium]|nr:hypothetical protein [Verrucomicrobiota bacterium]
MADSASANQGQIAREADLSGHVHCALAALPETHLSRFKDPARLSCCAE